MKAKVHKKNNHIVIKIKLKSPELIDNDELDMICRVYVRGFLKPTLYKQKILEYRGTSGNTLRKYLKGKLSKWELLFILRQLVLAASTIKNSNLRLNGLWLNLNYIYVNPETKELQFIYLPITAVQDNPDVVAFMKLVAQKTKPSLDSEDSDFVPRFLYFLSSLNSSDYITAIIEYLEQEDSFTRLTGRQGVTYEPNQGMDRNLLSQRSFHARNEYINAAWARTMMSTTEQDEATVLPPNEATVPVSADGRTILEGENQSQKSQSCPFLRRVSKFETKR